MVTENLFKEIGKLEHLVNKTFFEKTILQTTIPKENLKNRNNAEFVKN